MTGLAIVLYSVLFFVGALVVGVGCVFIGIGLGRLTVAIINDFVHRVLFDPPYIG